MWAKPPDTSHIPPSQLTDEEIQTELNMWGITRSREDALTREQLKRGAPPGLVGRESSTLIVSRCRKTQ